MYRLYDLRRIGFVLAFLLFACSPEGFSDLDENTTSSMGKADDTTSKILLEVAHVAPAEGVPIYPLKADAGLEGREISESDRSTDLVRETTCILMPDKTYPLTAFIRGIKYHYITLDKGADVLNYKGEPCPYQRGFVPRFWVLIKENVPQEPTDDDQGGAESSIEVQIQTAGTWFKKSPIPGNRLSAADQCFIPGGTKLKLATRITDEVDGHYFVAIKPDNPIPAIGDFRPRDNYRFHNKSEPCHLTRGYIWYEHADWRAALSIFKIPRYTIYTPFLYDSSPPGAWDFTLTLSGSDYVPVPSPCAGIITTARNSSAGYGNRVEVLCNGTAYTWFMGHFHKISVRVRQAVAKGQTLGIQGMTGHATGPHVHLEIGDRNGNTITNRNVTKPQLNRYFSFLRGY